MLSPSFVILAVVIEEVIYTALPRQLFRTQSTVLPLRALKFIGNVHLRQNLKTLASITETDQIKDGLRRPSVDGDAFTTSTAWRSCCDLDLCLFISRIYSGHIFEQIFISVQTNKRTNAADERTARKHNALCRHVGWQGIKINA